MMETRWRLWRWFLGHVATGIVSWLTMRVLLSLLN